MATEFEVKYAVEDLLTLDCILCDAQLLPLLQGRYENIQMQTTYYDTPDGALSARRWTLRLRQENGKSVITLKTPSSGYARGEFACEGEYLDEAADALVAAGAPEEIRALLADGELAPVCGAKFVRITAPLHLEDRTRCAICADIGDLTGGGKKAPLCELELELLEGKEKALVDFAAALAARYHLKEEPASKFARARALAQNG